ncbi:D-3-phosphoglycerate dehydrogenase [Clostridium bornimense]|uniref:D-3-phosphoglycerate dehydrogenase n=1 Tax=Clostridium bornimense TaxID=1216932 RepID=W6SH34_9CLOT|nr:C-terminal binding protein [Clostridium bornimense]CDM68980.1 D-3-phosphoglycerate dehydrogenase [Clostridium bornimense]
MKIVICDYPDVLIRDLDYEKKLLQDNITDAEIVIYQYKDNKEEFIEVVKDADAILTAFLPIDKEIIDKAKKLKCISINAVGYDTVDVIEASKKKISVLVINEYCTQEVADHTLSLILSLERGIKHYINDIDRKHIWQYQSIDGLRRLEDETLGIFGFGKIGQAVAKRALAFGMKVVVVDPYVDKEKAKSLGVEIVDEEYILEYADIISNHMSQNNENKDYFNRYRFSKMKRSPIFINVGRGGSVNESDLLEALDMGIVRGAGLDVLKEENPNLEINELINRENVIITPHAAFYSEKSMRSLQKISCENIIYYFNGEMNKVSRVVNIKKDKS